MTYCGESTIKDGELHFEHICTESGTLCGKPRCYPNSGYLVNGDSVNCEECKRIYKLIKSL